MTIEELIKKLKERDPTSLVLLVNEDGSLRGIDEVRRVNVSPYDDSPIPSRMRYYGRLTGQRKAVILGDFLDNAEKEK